MQYDPNFLVRYRVDEPVPVKEIIESLQGIEVVLRETAAFLPSVFPGLDVISIKVKVRQIIQESPLRELFVLSIFLAFQKNIESEVPPLIEQVIHHQIPHSMDTMVTLLSLIVVFYGVGAIKDFTMGKAEDGPSERKLKSLIAEVAQISGTSETVIREKLDARYADKAAWKRLTNATARFWRVSKREDSAPVDVNDQNISRETIRDIPAHYLFDDAKETDPARDFHDVALELHAQDKDHGGQGWAAVVPGITNGRVKLKLMPGVKAGDLWGLDSVNGDVTVLYDRVGIQLIPKAVHLHRVN